MNSLRETLQYIIREPRVPTEFVEEFKRSVLLSNSRRLKAVSIPLFTILIIFMIADFLTVSQSGAQAVWNSILILRPIAIIVCVLFYWALGPLRSINDLAPRHSWLWKAYITFFLIYTATIVGYMFPLKATLSPIYIFLLGPPVLLSMTTVQTLIHLVIGYSAVLGAYYFLISPSESTHYQLINAAIMLWAGYILSRITYTSSYRDFMNKKVIEQKNVQLEEAHAEAQGASRAKSEFLAAISHEIRTPMNSILGMTEIALHTKLSSEQRDYIETARESGLLLMDVINDILDFSRIEARKFRLISAHFDLPAVIHSAVKTVKFKADQKGLDLRFEIMSDVPRFLKGDPGRLRQVLINLLDNGITYTDEGYVRLTVGLWADDSGDPERPVGLRFSIKDSGIGIPENMLDDIFEAFSQGDSSASRQYGGSGLGLSISKRLIGFMGGTISVKSEVGKGSEFLFTARFDEGDSTLASEPELMNASWNVNLPIKPSRVLLVDDNPINVKVELLHLDRMGMQTTVAESGQQALDQLAENEFDLVLMDLEMPDMDGYEAAHHIRSGGMGDSLVKQPDIPILAVTAHALGEIRSRCEKAGMDGFIAKPVGFGELGSAMRQILGGDWREAPPQPQHEGPAVLDLITAANLLGVTKTEINHLVPNAIAEIEQKFGLAETSVEKGILREVALQSHTLKSVAASIGAEATRRAAVKLENASRRDDGPLSLQRLEELRMEVLRLQKAVKAL